MRVAFDIDDTLWKVRHYASDCVEDQCPENEYCSEHRPQFDQVPDYALIQVLLWFVNNGDDVFIWSAGGVNYAEQISRKLGLDHLVSIIPKGKFGDTSNPYDIDIAFDDDAAEQIAKINVHVKRNHKKIYGGTKNK